MFEFASGSSKKTFSAFTFDLYGNRPLGKSKHFPSHLAFFVVIKANSISPYLSGSLKASAGLAFV